MIKTTLSILILLSQIANANDPCGYELMTQPNGPQSLISSCAFHKGLVTDKNDKRPKDNLRKSIHENLAKKLAIKITQNSEELSLFTTFFNKNGNVQVMNGEKVKNNCRLESLHKIEKCDGFKPSPYLEEKLNFLKKNLPKNSHTPFKGDESLYGLMAGKYYTDLGMQPKNRELECPLNPPASFFTLESQFDEESAKEIISTIKKDKTIDNQLNKYAQLKILSTSDNTELMTLFKKHVENISNNTSENRSMRDHLSSFFTSPSQNVQKLLEKSISDQCVNIKKNLETFLCTDIDELGSLNDNASKYLFGGLNTKEPIEDQYDIDYSSNENILAAYGMQCIAKEKALKKTGMENKREQSVDDWFKKFTDETRTEALSDGSNTVLAKVFCSHYKCESKESQMKLSCKSGGPISSKDLFSTFKCPSDSCDRYAQKSISYLEQLEELKKDSKNESKQLASSTSQNLSQDSKSTFLDRLPDFAENYFGVEGTLKALEKPITSETVSAREKDFESRQLITKEDSNNTNTPSIFSQKQPELPKTKEPEVTPTSQATSQVTPAYNPIRSVPETTNSFMPATSARSTSATNNKIVETDSPDVEESRALRKQLEQMVDGFKADQGQPIQAASPTQAQTAAGKFKPASLDIAAYNENQAEADRLAKEKSRLDERARRLDDYANEIERRKYYKDKEQDPLKNNGTASQIVSENATSDSSNSATPSSGGSGALLRSTATAAQKTDKNAQNTNLQSNVNEEGALLTAENLSILSKETLIDFGIIDSSKSFVLRINFENKVYTLTVKRYLYNGSVILGPALDSQNEKLVSYLKKSPLFKDYYDYQNQKTIKQ